MQSFELVEILYVEDNVHDAELTIPALKDGGLANKLLWLRDGQQALDYMFQQGEYAERGNDWPRLVLLDLKMPRLDGIEVLQAIRADDRTRMVPVVIMTSSQEESDIVRSYDLGVNSYVVKPVDFAALTQFAHHAGYHWIAINRAPDFGNGE